MTPNDNMTDKSESCSSTATSLTLLDCVRRLDRDAWSRLVGTLRAAGVRLVSSSRPSIC